jgi:putative PIN family toxin of toxin-antitoxin system
VASRQLPFANRFFERHAWQPAGKLPRRDRAAPVAWYHSCYHGAVRVILDTNVLVAAIRSRNGASFEVLSRVGTEEFEIAVSVPLVLEYEDALLRQLSTVTTLNEEDVVAMVDYITSVAIHQQIFFLWRPMLRDPGDDMVLELAVAAECDAIITHNARDFSAATRFGMRVLAPSAFLQLLRGVL